MGFILTLYWVSYYGNFTFPHFLSNIVLIFELYRPPVSFYEQHVMVFKSLFLFYDLGKTNVLKLITTVTLFLTVQKLPNSFC